LLPRLINNVAGIYFRLQYVKILEVLLSSVSFLQVFFNCSLIYSEVTAARLIIFLGLFNFILKSNSLIVILPLQLLVITQNWRFASIISVIHFIIPSSTSWTAHKLKLTKVHTYVPNLIAIKIFSSWILIIFFFFLSNSFSLYRKRFPLFLIRSLTFILLLYL
jgi:hypothetical protein